MVGHDGGVTGNDEGGKGVVGNGRGGGVAKLMEGGGVVGNKGGGL